MKRLALLIAVVLAVAAGGAARAQERFWLQIEAQPTLREAEERAAAYSGAFEDVMGFALSSGWYAIVLGPHDREGAQVRLTALLRDRMVPRDSFVADGGNFRARFWPPEGAVAPAIIPVTPEPEPAPAVTAPQEPPAPVAEPRETLAQSRAAEARLTRGERQDIQSALRWFGFYDAAIDGAFGPGTRAAISAWQQAAGQDPTGVLTTAQHAGLVGDWRAVQAELGLQSVTDEPAGITIDLPMGLVEFDRHAAPFAHYIPRNDSGVRVLLISQPGDQAALFGLYDMLQTLEIVPPSGPRERRARNFEISALDMQVASYSYAELSGGLIKGFILVWRPEDGARMQPVLEAMKTSFKSAGTRALDPTSIPLSEDHRAGMVAGLEARRPVHARSGFYVDGAGTVLTAVETVAGCGRITLDGGQEAQVSLADATLGIAVLRPRAALAPQAHAQFAPALPRPGAEVMVAGFSFGTALAQPTMTFGRFEDDKGLTGEPGLARLSLNPMEGDAGGAVLDAGGAVIGLLRPAPAATDGRVLPPEVAFIAPAPAIAEALRAAGIAPAEATRQGALAPEDLAAIGGQMAVMVSCWE